MYRQRWQADSLFRRLSGGLPAQKHAVRFLRNASHQPFLLVVSQLEPHFQNDCNCFVGPQRAAPTVTRIPSFPATSNSSPATGKSSCPAIVDAVASVGESVGTITGERYVIWR